MPERLAVVLDTNVVLDLLVFDDAQARPLLTALQEGALEAWADARTLEELRQVLGYASFGLDAAAQAALLARYGALVRVAPPMGPEQGARGELPRCADRDDQKFLELAARAGARWLVSKDKQLLQLRGWKSLPFLILRPPEAAARLGP
ncbi:putative toxin-antitoxin system toxin component, PIN family [Aggregicoccus sp. 17bor-14]|uniref:putative toxin-antitoxin system toxin component, PIN family n=1 Tax=Myxococcaceae TaxID=31 RepID=UPI00129C5511|nr:MULTISPECIES: putative toxin-antitoxin system toxin component, PIN family [Myxococcaceae]MBF5046439.1 putative toxin-antitoxin system toxin component, PIN family [Simulacricoccus sp. 17bor-14]MRI92158.1 putative toxin-antitoxin system toxin component, PIN family [Aggregicoccus sp. 17bor-14]